RALDSPPVDEHQRVVDRGLAPRSVPLRAPPVDGGVARDRQQPRAHRATLGPIPARLAPDRMERILGDLLGGLGTPEHPVDESEHDAAVAVVQLAEGIGVAAGHPRHEASIFTRLIAGYEVIRRHGSPPRSRTLRPARRRYPLAPPPPDSDSAVAWAVPQAAGRWTCLSSRSGCRRPVPGLPGGSRAV